MHYINNMPVNNRADAINRAIARCKQELDIFNEFAAEMEKAAARLPEAMRKIALETGGEVQTRIADSLRKEEALLQEIADSLSMMDGQEEGESPIDALVALVQKGMVRPVTDETGAIRYEATEAGRAHKEAA